VYLGIAFLCTWVGCAIGNFSGSVARNFFEAQQIAPTLAAPLMMFGGFFSNAGAFSGSFGWIKYFSPFYYGFQALTINEFTDLTLDPGIQNPLPSLGFTGEAWTRAGSLLAMKLVISLLIIGTLKILTRVK
jgi:ABC-2 type transporter